MHVLLVSISAPPKNSPESLQTGRYLKYLSRETEVTLLTTDPSGGWEPVDQSLSMYLTNVSQIISLYSPPTKIISLLRKVYPKILTPDESFSFFWQLRQAIKKVHKKPSVILSRSAPFSSAIMGMKLAQYWKVPWVMHLSDLWIDSPFIELTRSSRKKNQNLERQCFEAAQIVTLTSEKTIEFYKKKYPILTNKFRFLPNVFDFEDRLQDVANSHAKLRFVFTGRLYGARSIHHFLDAVEHAARLNPDIAETCEILFAGFFDDHNLSRIKQSTLSSVRYLGSVTLHESLELQRSAHVLISIDSLEPDPTYDLFFPSKLLDYIAAKKMILAITRKTSTTYDVVQDKFGKCFYPEIISSLPNYILQLVRDFKKDPFKLFANDSADISTFEAKTNTVRLNRILKEAIESYG